MGALKAIKINQNDGRAVFLCLPKTKYRVTKGFKFHARPQTGAYSCCLSSLCSLHCFVFSANDSSEEKYKIRLGDRAESVVSCAVVLLLVVYNVRTTCRSFTPRLDRLLYVYLAHTTYSL